MMCSIPGLPWWAGSLLANVCIARIEAINRAGGHSDFGAVIFATWWLILVSQYGLFNAFNGAPSFMAAWAFFTVGNMGLRLLNAYFVVGEPLNLGTWLGVSMMFGGMLVVKWATT